MDGSMDEVRRRSCRTRHRQKFSRWIDSGYFKPGLDQSFRQRSVAAAHIHHAPDGDACRAVPPDDFWRRATRKRSERSGLNVRQVLLVKCGHE